MRDGLPDMLDLLIVASLCEPKTVLGIYEEFALWRIPLRNEDDVYDRVHHMRQESLLRVYGGEPTKEACVYSPSANGRGMLRRWSYFLEDAVDLVRKSGDGLLYRDKGAPS